MIEVSVRWDGITVNGHAGYAAMGSDIVCASVSVLTKTLIASLEDLTAYWRMAAAGEVKKNTKKERLICCGFYDLATAYQSMHVNC